MPEQYDIAIVGAGIIGLAHAYHLARRGLRVIVFERSPRAMGASVRNFGMLWPIGQTAGEMVRMARRSRDIWRDVLAESGLWHEECGSLHLAYRPDEAAVLEEFVAASEPNGFDCRLLSAAETRERSPAVNPDGLRGAMWSPTEICVDPRQVIAALPGWLEQRFGVRFVFDCAVTGYDAPTVTAGGREWRAERLFVCSGDDIQTLYPEVLQAAGFTRCKLQMMRSQPYAQAFRIGPMLAAGLTLRHYKSFETCPSLDALKRRIAEETLEFDRYGIHVLVSQHGSGELTIGDSHEYDGEITPFDRTEINDLILNYLKTFLIAPELRIASRWNGQYLKHPTQSYFVAHPAPGVTIVTGVGGAGMTLSFGLAEMVITHTQEGDEPGHLAHHAQRGYSLSEPTGDHLLRRRMKSTGEIFALFAERGDEAYFGEPVSQTEHALQAALLAEQAGASDALTVAALLHDIGHLIHGLGEDIADSGVDARHEEAGEVWLSRRFGPEVTEPVKLHVAAKRYLCAAEPDYLAQLSPASMQSLALQGGPFSPEEQREFQANPFYREAVQLRRWDDEAKIAGLATPPLEHYRERIERVALR